MITYFSYFPVKLVLIKLVPLLNLSVSFSKKVNDF